MVPVVSFTYTRHQESSVKLSYMSGVNVGNNNQFVNSLGHNNKLWLSNLYFTDFIRPERTMKLSQLIASGWILILFCMILGGTIL
jgi:ech hydrogenase subunit A